MMQIVGRSSVVSQLRTAAGIASLFPVAAGAIGVGLMASDRRSAVNYFTSHWMKLVLTTAGISLNVLGQENLTAQRPAVFIFNHRNQADVMIAGRLVADNFTSVAKKELENDPLIGTIAKVAEVVFVDRDNPQAAIQSLQKVEALARKGISVLISPEGTRVATNTVGTFKKGPFRIAMAAGIPIIPIVIRNAEAVAGRHSATLRPGAVDVAVYPPVPTDDWTLEQLPNRIAEIRQIYIDALESWPQDTTPFTGSG